MQLNKPIDQLNESNVHEDQKKLTIGNVLEIIFAVIILLGIIVRDAFGFARNELAFFTCCLLALIYLFANFWVAKPQPKTFRTALITILYGISSSSLIFAFVFTFLFLPGDFEMTLVSFTLLGIIIFIDLVSSIRKPKVTSYFVRWRLLIISATLILYSVFEEDSRIRFTYRNYPDFIKYYELNKDAVEFTEIEDTYFKDSN
jgi:hypothetical protein